MQESVHNSAFEATPTVRVELFGVPRLLTHDREVGVVGESLGEIAASLVHARPALAGKVLDRDSGWPLDGYVFVVDGQFTRDRARPITPDTSVLLVSSVAGG